MKPPKTAEAMQALIAEVQTYVDAVEEYERRHCEVMAKVNALGGRIDRAMDTMRELIEMVKQAR